MLGLFSYLRLRVEQMPDISLPFVLIQTRYPGASPEAVETDVTKPIEYAVNQVSRRQADPLELARRPSQVFVEFRLDDRHGPRDAGRARQDRAGAAGFPRDVKDPLVVARDNENAQPVVVARRACRRRAACAS